MKRRALLVAFSLVVAQAAGAESPDLEADPVAAASAPCFGEPLCFGAGPIAAWPVLSLRSGYELQQPSSRVAFVGNHDGFRTDQLWAGFQLYASSNVGAFEARVVMDGARLLPGTAPNEPVRRLVLAAADAFVAWRPFGGDLAVRVGQQRMPSDEEGRTELGGFVFATRSVASAGVEPGRGFALEGLSVGRQLGLVVEDGWTLPLGFRVAYAGGVANGNGSNRRANDNAVPSWHLRLEGSFRDVVRVAAGGHFDPRTVGRPPIQQDETVMTGFAEASAGLWGFDVLALGHVRRVSFDSALPDAADPGHARIGYGGTAWLLAGDPFGFETHGVRGGYRVSWITPAVALPDESLLEHAFAIRYDPGYLPYTSFIVDFTSLWAFGEAGLISAEGNRVFALVHVEL